MAHSHSIYSTDKHFKIDPITRDIVTETSKLSLMQYDHNSERYTFEIPRYIEGHDMSLTDAIKIHYINVGSTANGKQPGVYEVEDAQISPDSSDVVIFSWLISRNCTKLSGTLNFAIRFNCIMDNELVYSYGTNIFTGIKVSNGLDNSEVVLEDYIDVLQQWKNDLVTIAESSTSYDYHTELTKTRYGNLRVWVRGGKPGEKYVVVPARQSRRNGLGPVVGLLDYSCLSGKSFSHNPDDDRVYDDVPPWMPKNEINKYWTVTISEKFKDAFIDIKLNKFLLPFIRPAKSNGTNTNEWIYNIYRFASVCYGTFIGEKSHAKGPFILKFLVVPYKAFFDDYFDSATEIIKSGLYKDFGNTSLNFMKVGTRRRNEGSNAGDYSIEDPSIEVPSDAVDNQGISLYEEVGLDTGCNVLVIGVNKDKTLSCRGLYQHTFYISII